MSRQRRFIVTTSWDDGSPEDLKMAELLHKYGLAGTFYIPVMNDERPVMHPREILALGKEFEIGSHTYHHRVLPGLPAREMRRQVLDGKRSLEQLLGREVPSFCYPKGKFSPKTIKCVKETGIRLARTTQAFNINPACSRFSCGTSLQAFPERPAIHLRHGLKEFNFTGIYLYAAKLHLASNWESLAMNLFDLAAEKGGIWHLWGHSWEIEAYGLWKKLEAVFQYVSGREQPLYMTNGEMGERARQNN
ncbi:MAG: polysaccharide deacetylase family protein [Desulfobacterales bacterium]|nr:polysaccharide deacetylase family protein [Desulfobacterales bacterium]